MVILFKPYLIQSKSETISIAPPYRCGITNPLINEEPLICQWIGCWRSFENLDKLSSHVAEKHASPGNDGLYFCGWTNCSRGNKGFNARYKMLVHVRTHTNEKPHHCCRCNKSFSRAENLKIHSRSHTGEKPYVCVVPGCGKAYSNSSDRFKHSRTHSIDKPYACKVPGCPKRYTDPSSLRKHVKTYKHYPVSPPNHDNNYCYKTIEPPFDSDCRTESKENRTTIIKPEPILPLQFCIPPETSISDVRSWHQSVHRTSPTIIYDKPLNLSKCVELEEPLDLRIPPYAVSTTN